MIEVWKFAKDPICITMATVKTVLFPEKLPTLATFELLVIGYNFKIYYKV